MKEKVRIYKQKHLALEDCKRLNDEEEDKDVIWKVKDIFGYNIIVKKEKEND